MGPSLCCFCFLLASVISGLEPKAVIARLEAKYHSSHTLQAAFLERYTENGHLVRVEAGTVYFRRPGKMRWEYESPEKNLFLVDGKTAWFYVPADHTVTRVPAKESSDWRTPLALLAGEMKISRVCETVRIAEQQAPESSENAMLYCVLRGTGEVKQTAGSRSTDEERKLSEAGEAVYFEVVSNTGELVRVLVKNAGGVAIEFHFTNWLYDPPVNDSLFRFAVSPGVAIVNGELPSGQNVIKP
ncbi:MAG TPA: outer membrane lipoprotein carrier protein LolA [Candidatus Acidoferrum sp.]|nr:outer membrane lipoprotein carrier protein LolA [Candidatus Acidoferrum sp.]